MNEPLRACRRALLAVLMVGGAFLASGCIFNTPEEKVSKPASEACATCPAENAPTCCSEKNCCEECNAPEAVDKAAESTAPGKGVAVKSASFKELTEFIKGQKGKVVVVDIWGTFCVPCKEEFHNLVEIHAQQAKEGVVCVSVALDPSETRDTLAFLKSKKASFANFLLDEEQTKTLTEKWDITAVPAVFVYDRDGKLYRFTMDDPDNQFTYKDVKAKLKKLLAKKS